MIRNPKVSIIIVNWNGLDWLPVCFKSLYQQMYSDFEIIFVDNASKDGSIEWVRKHYPKSNIVSNTKNLGFAEGNNIGFRKAKGDYILFLNNDTRVTKNFLTELIRVCESDNNIGGAQSKILLMDAPDTHDSVGAFLTPTGFLYHYGYGKKNSKKYDSQIDLYTAKGACMMFRKTVLDSVAVKGNIFDPDYFAYFEETDMCHRIWLAGYRVVYAYKSVIYHKMGATSGIMDNTFIQYHSFKNRIRTYIKNFGTLWLCVFLPIHMIICQIYALASCFQGIWTVGWAIERACWWNLARIRHTFLMRKIVQRRIRQVADKDIGKVIMKYPDVLYYVGLLLGKVYV